MTTLQDIKNLSSAINSIYDKFKATPNFTMTFPLWFPLFKQISDAVLLNSEKNEAQDKEIRDLKVRCDVLSHRIGKLGG